MLFGRVYCIVDYRVYFACDTIIVDVCLFGCYHSHHKHYIITLVIIRLFISTASQAD